MIYFENIDRKYSKVIARKCLDINDEVYWKISVPSLNKIYNDFLSVDTFAEAQIWCDLHNLEIVKIMDQVDEYNKEVNLALRAHSMLK